MAIQEKLTRTPMVLVILTAQGLAAGCVASPGLVALQDDEGTVEICEKRGSHTMCSTESISALSNDMEVYHEQQEMREQERSEEW